MPENAHDNFAVGEIAHIFNVWPVESCFTAITRAKAVGKKVVLSPIYLNLANSKLYSQTIPKIFSLQSDGRNLDVSLKMIAQEIEEEDNLPIREPYPGYHARVRACIAASDHVICLSDYEKRCLDHIGAKMKSWSLVRNGVDGNKFGRADPSLFAKTYGLENYILCVGRIEPRKNQLVLAHAARRLKKKLVLIGHEGNPSYMDLVRQTGGANTLFISRIDPSDPLLSSAFAGAEVFCLPSWAEGAPLAALEAAAAGTPLVLSDRSSEREYFGDFAEYTNPANWREGHHRV